MQHILKSNNNFAIHLLHERHAHTDVSVAISEIYLQIFRLLLIVRKQRPNDMVNLALDPKSGHESIAMINVVCSKARHLKCGIQPSDVFLELS